MNKLLCGHYAVMSSLVKQVLCECKIVRNAKNIRNILLVNKLNDHKSKQMKPASLVDQGTSHY